MAPPKADPQEPFRSGPLAAGLRRQARTFLDQHPYERNVFVMMRYRNAEHFREIEEAIGASLAAYGLQAHWAKDKEWDDDLWGNIRLYMHACKYGLVVFEQIDERDFNPNVSLELGYMYALGRRCFLLKEMRMPRMPTDIFGKLYKEFDQFHLRESLRQRREEWVRDLGFVATQQDSVRLLEETAASMPLNENERDLLVQILDSFRRRRGTTEQSEER
ncbi:MAG: hypothetical protein NTZ05_12470 [Chloroflexi bacterium]|nr:hypothetical protein [Chloroflexota bacterium]